MEKVGLQAILDDKDFQNRLSSVMAGYNKIVTGSEQAASRSTSAWSALSKHFVITAGDIANVAQTVFSTLQDVATKGLKTTLEWGESLDRLGDMFGMNGAEATKWSVALQHVGLSLDEGAQGLNFFTKGLAETTKITKEGKTELTPFGEALQKLGVKAFDAQGKLKTFDTVMPEIMDAFQKLPAGVNSSALAMELFGARGGSKFLDFLRQGSAGLKTAEKFAKDFGLELETDTVNAAEEFGFTMNDLNLAVKGVWNQIGKAMLPIVRDLAEYVKANVLPTFSRWAKDYAPMITEALREIGKWVNQEVLPRVRQMVDYVVAHWPEIQKTINDAWQDVIKPALEAFEAWLKSDGVKALQTFFDKIEEFRPLAQEWKSLMGDILGATKSTTSGMTQDAGIQLPRLADIVGAAMERIKNVSQQNLTAIRDIQLTWNSLITGDWTNLSRGLQYIVADLLTILTDRIGINLRTQHDQIQAWAFNLGRDFGETLNAQVGGMTGAAWNAMASIYNTIAGWGGSIVSIFRNPFDRAKSAVEGIDLAGAAWGLMRGVWDTINGWIGSILGVLRSPFDQAWNFISGFNFGGAVWQAMSTIYNMITGWYSSIFNSIIAPFQNAWDWITQNNPTGGGSMSGPSGFGLRATNPVSMLTGGGSTTNYSQQTVNNYNLSVNSAAPVSTLRSDFGIMQALASV